MTKKKKGCIGCGCATGVAFIALVIAYLYFENPRIPPEVQQKSLESELRMPPGTKLTDGVAIEVLVDVSGSMLSKVADEGGRDSKKIEIARRVTAKTLDAIQAYASKNPDKTIQAGLIKFGSHAAEVLPIGKPDPAQFPGAIESLESQGATAIGEAMVAAKRQLNHAALKKQYMIVITDGENTNGRAPEDVMKAMNALPAEQQATVYFVAFDVAAKVFEPLVKEGVSLSEARDAKGLQAALDYILYEKILVEQE